MKRQCFAQFGKRSAACRAMFSQQNLETKRCENIRERDSRWRKYSNPVTRTMLNPRTPKSQCFSVRVTKSDIRGLIFFVHGANALQATLALNFGGEGVVPDRRGLNTSFIYGTNWGVRHAAHPSWYCLAL